MARAAWARGHPEQLKAPAFPAALHGWGASAACWARPVLHVPVVPADASARRVAPGVEAAQVCLKLAAATPAAAAGADQSAAARRASAV